MRPGGSGRQNQPSGTSSAQRPAGPSQASQRAQSTNQTPSSDPENFRLQALADPRIADRLRQWGDDLGDALVDSLHDPAEFSALFQRKARPAWEREAEKQRELALLNEDPFNIEAQQKIEEIIRQQRVQENLQDAMDFSPEGIHLSHLSRFLGTSQPLRITMPD